MTTFECISLRRTEIPKALPMEFKDLTSSSKKRKRKEMRMYFALSPSELQIVFSTPPRIPIF